MVDPDFTRKSGIKIYCVPSFSNKEKYCMLPLCALARSWHFSNTKKKTVAQWAQTQSVIFHSAVPMPVLSCQSEQDMSLLKSLYGLSFLLAESNSSSWPTRQHMLVPDNFSSLTSCYLLLRGPAEFSSQMNPVLTLLVNALSLTRTRQRCFLLNSSQSELLLILQVFVKITLPQRKFL